MRSLVVLMKLAFLLLCTNLLSAQTQVESVIKEDQVWDIEGSPYVIDQTTVVPADVKVVVMPGAVIQGNNNTLYIEGGFQVLGKEDSIIKIEELTVHYKEGSKDFNPVTKEGAYFKHALIDRSDGISYGTAVFLSGTDFTIEDCRFYGSNTAIDFRSNESKLNIDRCDFKGNTGFYRGNKLNISNYHALASIRNSSFSYCGRISIYSGHVTFANCEFYYIDGIQAQHYDEVKFVCNSFSRHGTVNINAEKDNNAQRFKFEYNTLDSFSVYMLSISSHIGSDDSIFIHHNNFLNGVKKIKISGNNQELNTSLPIDLSYNYWNSNDTLEIDAMITDYKDEILIAGEVDYSYFYSDTVIGCTMDCPSTEFTIEVKNESQVNVHHRGSNSYMYDRVWTFGSEGRAEGLTLQDESLTYFYQDTAGQMICLYVKDNAGNICDSNCQVINWKVGLPVMESLNQQMLIYPNPNNGSFQVMVKGEISAVKVFNALGQVQDVLVEYYPGRASIQFDAKPGVYLLEMLTKDGNMYTARFLKN